MITHTVERVDFETGEVTKRENTIIKKEDKEEYVRIFLGSIAGIVGAKLTGAEHNILYMIQRYTINNSNLILYNSAAREEIAKKLGLKPATVKKAVEKLVKTGILERPKRGMYYLNPVHFGRGDWKSIKKLRKEIKYEYDFEEMEIKEIHKAIATYENEENIRNEIIDAEIQETEVKKIDNKTTETVHTIKKKRPSFIGAGKGKIGDVDAKQVRREMSFAKDD